MLYSLTPGSSWQIYTWSSGYFSTNFNIPYFLYNIQVRSLFVGHILHEFCVSRRKNIFLQMTHNIIWKPRKSHNWSSLTTKIKLQYIFWLRFGSANAIHNYFFLSRVACGENFNLNCLLIEFVMLNLSHIYFCILQIFKTNFSSRFF